VLESDPVGSVGEEVDAVGFVGVGTVELGAVVYVSGGKTVVFELVRLGTVTLDAVLYVDGGKTVVIEFVTLGIVVLGAVVYVSGGITGLLVPVRVVVSGGPVGGGPEEVASDVVVGPVVGRLELDHIPLEDGGSKESVADTLVSVVLLSAYEELSELEDTESEKLVTFAEVKGVEVGVVVANDEFVYGVELVVWF
jgi:hypothetical protein